jgi:uncharacterized protein (TIGR02271 family)
MKDKNTVIGVFDDQTQAQRAINDLKRAGFTEKQIGVTAHSRDEATKTDTESQGTHAAQGAATGLAAGAGVGALWGLGIVAGLIPAIGPAIAGGTLAAILSSAGAGAAAAGLAGTLIGFGIPEDEAKYYEDEFHAGRTIVSVHADGREAEARSILQRYGSYDRTDRGTTARSRAGTASGQGQRTIEAREEELHVNKQRVQTGEVNVHKEVHTEHKSIDVPVQKEEVVIERHAVKGRDASGPVGGDESIRVPVSEERVNVEKRPIVTEEVTVGKRTTEKHEPVRTDVRKEEIEVDKRGRGDVRKKDR